jgi:hypothetical protein
MAKKVTPATARRELERRRQVEIARLGEWLHDLLWLVIPRIEKLEQRVQQLEDRHRDEAEPPADEPIERSD